VGLTGGIASGKSVLAGCLERSGCAVLDLDRLAHQVMAPGGPAYASVVAAFGRDVLAGDGTIDRKRLGAIVFRDAGERERLNAIVHPLVQAEEARRGASLETSGARVAVSEAALLVETGLHLRFDRLIVAHCSPEQQRLRLERRNGLSAEAAQARLDAQMPAASRLNFAHLSVDTSGSLSDTERAGSALADELLELSVRAIASPPGHDRLLAGLAAAAAASPFAARFIEEVVESGRIDLRRIAKRFGPASEPWYLPRGDSGNAPSAIAFPVVAHLLSRPLGNDRELVASAMASVGRSLGDDVTAWADGCALGLATAQRLAGGAAVQDDHLWQEWTRLARRWTGAAPRVASVDASRRLVSGGTAAESPAPLREVAARFLALAR